jgi:ribosome-binding protein aMBF1 (putative translation factor)
MNKRELNELSENITDIKNKREVIYKKQDVKRKAFLNKPENQNEISKIKASIKAAQVIHKLRLKAGFTQKEIAEKLNMKQPNYARIEKGQNITVNTLADIANACGAEIDIKYHLKHI